MLSDDGWLPPEVVRMNTEFEASIERNLKNSNQESHHHEQTKSSQVTFAKQVQSMVQVMHEEMGNPFLEETNDLLKLDTKDIVDQAVAVAVCQAEKIGQQQYDDFVTERLQDQSTPISQPIRKNKLLLFSRPPVRLKSSSKLQVSSLKSDVSLFSRLYIACQSRDGDLDDFFRHENGMSPIIIPIWKLETREQVGSPCVP
ncbi:hypothetical protein BSL78_25015 [Apostichopus japonicus]|uniref:Uncharacterized protein n=1 Tax=Stichopus japonicus TaxID=307972 RepID=A0A2G8JR12_STIJA|nr:hypothetical protein BSL78_25015 [Apostichopus japonicus]